jgi:dTDP-4-dehydrorhamnose reductase
MRLLVLGRDGQVGTALQKLLPAVGDVVALGREGADFEVPGRLAGIVKRERPDVIINAAAYTAVDKAESEPERAARINAGAPGELAEAAAKAGAWLIHYSTDYVFDGSGDRPWVETDATAPLSVYGRTKRDGEVLIGKSGAKHLIFRTSWVHAPGGNNFIAKILKLAAERDELKVIDDQVGAPTSALLIAEVTAKAIELIGEGRAPASGIYHLAAAGETTWNGYARFAIADAMTRGAALKVTPERVLKVPTTAFPTPAQRPLNSRLSTEKLRQALGIMLPDWQDDVRLTLDALIAEPTP